MPKTKTIFSTFKSFLISDMGSQMVAQMWRKNNSASQSEFIRDAITFFIQEKHPKYFAAWNKIGVPEINEFKQHDARENGLTYDEAEELDKFGKELRKHLDSKKKK